MIRKVLLPFAFLTYSFLGFSQGENCSTAESITTNGNYDADGPSSGGGCTLCEESTHADWYTFTSPQVGLLNVNSCGLFSPETRLYLWKGQCGGLSQMVMSTEDCGFQNGSLIQNFITEAGATYFLEWDNFHNEEAFSFSFDYSPILGCSEPIADDVDSVSFNFARVTWNSANAPSEFGIEYGPFGFDPGSGTTITGSVEQLQNSVDLTGLDPNTIYGYRLWEVCSGIPSDTVTGGFITSDPCPIPNFFGFNETEITETSATLDWNSQNEGATFYLGYSIAPLDLENAEIISGVVGTDGPPIVLNDLQDDTQYAYAYWEVCAAGPSDTTLGMSFRTESYCETPFFLTVQETTGNSATFNWFSQNDTGTFYIEYGVQGFALGTGTVVSGPVGTQPYILTGLNPNTVYEAYLWEECINGYSSDTLGPEVFNTFTGAPTNDNCVDAETLVCGNTFSTSSTFASDFDTPTESCFLDAQGPGVWYTIEGNDKKVTLDLCGSDYDTQVLVFQGSCDDYSCVIGNDDFSGCPDYQSRVAFEALSGENYLVFVGGYEGETGTLILEVSCEDLCEPKPENDECVDAIAILIEGTDCTGESYTTTCSTPSLGFQSECSGFSTIADVWFSFNSGSSGSFDLFMDFENEAGEFGLAVYSTCDAATLVGCTDQIPSGENLGIDLEPNTDYLLQVWSEIANEADFNLCLREQPNSIQEFTINELVVFPNPSTGVVNLNNLEERYLVVSDMAGKEHFNGTVTNSVDLSHLNQGMYLLQLDGFKPTRLVLE